MVVAPKLSDVTAFLIKATNEGVPAVDICNATGISRRGYHQWKRKYSDGMMSPEKREVRMETPPRERVKVFVVHGHDKEISETVARFMERVGFESIILHEQASQGRTIIEKFEAHASAGFAIVLLTPDDIGGPKGGKQRARARQNVIFELGFFVARLGRGKVCALKRGDVEIPSDFAGVTYIDFDSGDGWRLALARELTSAGYEVNLSKLM
jgi:predicted nucleotide-binding protein